MVKKKVSLSFDDSLWGKFKVHCQLAGLKMSGKVESLVRDYMKGVRK